jgi:cysteine synthase A
MNGAIKEANKLVSKEKNAIILQQFKNKNNPLIHEKTTALEILNDMDNNVDIFISVVGTGGTISGIGKVLKQNIQNILIIAVEPTNSAVLSGEEANTHKIQGIGAGFIPEVLDTTIYDKISQISDDDAINRTKQLAKEEGLLVGISSGANLEASIIEASKEENRDKNIVTILCDTGERYLSTEVFNN